MPVILSYIQARSLLEARRREQSVVEISPDLGLSTTRVTMGDDGVSFATGERVDWDGVEKVSRSETTCYRVSVEGVGGVREVQPMQVFSQETNRLCSLMPTTGAPSVLIAGFVMHRFKDIDPWQHAQRMVATIAPVRGSLLDTTTGLGYTAILAARTAEKVTAIELDPGVQTIARLNPWSQELFDNPIITQIMGDAFDVVTTFASESFDRILHDPPAFKLAGDLYSGAFYRELQRILKRGGRLFHYIGDPDSKTGGRFTYGVVQRLQEAGFSHVVRRAEAYGVVAYK